MEGELVSEQWILSIHKKFSENKMKKKIICLRLTWTMMKWIRENKSIKHHNKSVEMTHYRLSEVENDFSFFYFRSFLSFWFFHIPYSVSFLLRIYQFRHQIIFVLRSCKGLRISKHLRTIYNTHLHVHCMESRITEKHEDSDSIFNFDSKMTQQIHGYYFNFGKG